MNEIKPFFGWRYNPKRVNLAEVMAPPYDIVTPEEQEVYLRKSPYNVFHLELGRIKPQDTETENRYTRARVFWEKWRKEGILIREEAPALYLYRLRFSWQGRSLVRRGIIGLIRLALWESGLIRPHEKTFSQVTEDRLNLLRATRAQFSQIFCLYHDQALKSIQSLEEQAETIFEVPDPQRFIHELARVTDPRAQEIVAEVFQREILYIADGHHRYTTALAYMEEMERRFGNKPPRCFHYVMMYLCPFEEPGLLVLPTHRLLKLDLEEEALISKLSAFGEFEPFNEKEKIFERLESLCPGKFLLVSKGKILLFRPRERVLAHLSERIAGPLKRLPVALFTSLLKEAFDLEEAPLKQAERLIYTPWVEEILEKSLRGWFGFLLPPTRVSALQEVADAGLVMPHKSTFFFPKILTGTVFFEILPDQGPPC